MDIKKMAAIMDEYDHAKRFLAHPTMIEKIKAKLNQKQAALFVSICTPSKHMDQGSVFSYEDRPLAFSRPEPQFIDPPKRDESIWERFLSEQQTKMLMTCSMPDHYFIDDVPTGTFKRKQRKNTMTLRSFLRSARRKQ